jgi:hypothetical protein
VYARASPNPRELTTRDTVSSHTAVGVAQGFPGDVGNGTRTEARQGAMRNFFGNPIASGVAPQPAAGFT